MITLLAAVCQGENKGDTFPKHLSGAREAFSFPAHCLTCPWFGSRSACNIGNDK